MTDPVTLPDHPVRKALWYQLLNRLPRALLLWLAAIAAAWNLGGAELFGIALDGVTRGINLAFVGALFGIKSIEAIKGVS